MLFPSGLFCVFRKLYVICFTLAYLVLVLHSKVVSVFLILVFSYLSSRDETVSIERMEERAGKWGVSH